ncbi:MAG: hypothetical protein ACP5QU_03540, partial [Anaerolineae bacterium]
AYYLIHNMRSGQGYTERERIAAHHFATAAAEAGVRHIIYLGGLADPEQHIAPHLRSRIETGAILRQGSVPVTEFRAGVIVGSGSISFEMIRFVTECFPLIPAPRWLKNKVQPIAVQNVVDYLLAALENHHGEGEVFEIGGPEVTTYGDLMLRYARLRGYKRRLLFLPYLPCWLMAWGISRISPVPYPIAWALVGGLSSDSVVLHPHVLQVFPEVQLISYEAAVRLALSRLHPSQIERVWEDGKNGFKRLKHEGFFIWQREREIRALPDGIFPSLVQRLWRWQVMESQFPLRLVARRECSVGVEWLEWHLTPVAGRTWLKETRYFAPRGARGFLFGGLYDLFLAVRARFVR